MLENVKAYLTNVSSEARLLQEKSFLPESVCNMAGLREDDLKRFRDKGLLVKTIPYPIGGQRIQTDTELFCYPNECIEESPGSPYTKLVLEGTIDGKTCYYPISINRNEDGALNDMPGIGRNCTYIYDLTIKTTGTSDPDTDVRPEDVVMECEILPWTEKEDTDIIF